MDFEKDQEEVLERATNLKSLANQVKILKELEDQVKNDEEALKEFKTYFSKPVKLSSNISISFNPPSKGYLLIILSNASLTFATAEWKNVWFSNLE